MVAYIMHDAQHAGAAYVTGLTIDFFPVVFGFVNALDFIMQQPLEAPERVAPQSAPDAQAAVRVQDG